MINNCVGNTNVRVLFNFKSTDIQWRKPGYLKKLKIAMDKY